MLTKNTLAIVISKLKVFEHAKPGLEQYPTPSDIVSDVLWTAYMNSDIYDKTVADLGAGSGFLGISALLLGAEKVYFVDRDKDAISILRENLNKIEEEYEFKGKYEIIESDIKDFNETVDTVIQNPPFGTKQKHADKAFLEKAFQVSNTVYSFHKTNTEKFIESISKDHDFSISSKLNFSFPIKATMSFHRKPKKYVKVSCFLLLRNKAYL